MRFTSSFKFMIIAASLAILVGCKGETVELEIPSTYVFERDGQSTVVYSGQTERLDMMDEMSNYMKGTRSLTGTVDGARLLAMYANEAGADFSGTYAKDLKSKSFSNDVSFFETWMTEMGTASQKGTEAADGTSGFLSETYGTGTPATADNAGYLVDANGIEYQQVIEKGLMGAVFFYQAMEIYLSSDRMGEIGNDDVEDGKTYTLMEHYFDEAFGYFGVPVDYPATTDGVRYWGKYTQARNDGTGTGRFTYPGINQTLSDAWRKGRAAIVAKDYTARDEAIDVIVSNWEKVIASTAADYMERAKDSRSPSQYKKHHYLSEAIGFSLALKYHFEGGNGLVAPKFDKAKLDASLAIVGPTTNLWTLTDAQLDEAIGNLISAFSNGVIE
ncbi:MAG: DUF4856 domain-containing protein [Bacteroidota bacterium]